MDATIEEQEAIAPAKPAEWRRVLTPAERATVAHHARELARTVRSKGLDLRALCGTEMMPAEAMAELDSARSTVDDLLHYGGDALSRGGISGAAMVEVHRMRRALDELSGAVERWRVMFPGECFPETVVAALMMEITRANTLHFRALTLGE
jgi:hypothetical protein